MPSSFKWTPEIDEYIANHINEMSYAEIAKVVSEMMGKAIKPDTLGNHCRTHGIKKTHRISNTGRLRTDFSFTEEHISFIKKIFSSDKTCNDIATEFNNYFGTSVTKYNIKGQLRKCGLIQKKHLKTFKRGSHPKVVPIGTERIGSGRRMCVKVRDDPLPSGKSNNWIPKSRYVYEKHYGPINQGDLIIHLNGNPDDFDIDNLECISKKELACMTRNCLYSKNKEVTKTGIMISKLFCILKDFGG